MSQDKKPPRLAERNDLSRIDELPDALEGHDTARVTRHATRGVGQGPVEDHQWVRPRPSDAPSQAEPGRPAEDNPRGED